MNKKAKLIWEFFGDDAAATAAHHAIHLKEFASKENIEQFGCDVEEKATHVEAYLIVDQKDMIAVRDALRPKRGEWAS